MTPNGKQYAYVAGFQGTIVSKLHKCIILAQSFKFAQMPTKKSNERSTICYAYFHFFSFITIYSKSIVFTVFPVIFVGEFLEGIDLLLNALS